MKRTVLIGVLFFLIPFCAIAMEQNPGCGDANDDDKAPPVAAMTGDGTMFDCTDSANKDLPECQPIEEDYGVSDTPCIGASGCRVTLDYCRDPYQGGFPSCSFTGSCSRSTYKNYCLSLIKKTCGGRIVQWIYLRTYDEWWYLN